MQMPNYWILGALALLVLLVIVFAMHKNSAYVAPTTAPAGLMGKIKNYYNEHK